MKTLFKTMMIALLATTVVACGDDDDDAETLECGEGTVVDEESGQCVADRPDECPEGEIADAQLGKCVSDGHSYCGEGAQLNEELGRCQADAVSFCGDGTVEEEDGLCIEENPVECGEHTVIASGECVPAEDVCGELLEQNEDYVCGINPAICGENTVFDVDEQRCTPEFEVECGPGTTAVDGVCTPSRTFYEDLAADPDVNINDEGGSTTIELGDVGDSQVLVGTIGEPEGEDREQVIHEVAMQGQSGQWIRVSVYSLGLPEPGFVNNGPFGYYRVSEKGGGIEATRDHLLPHDGNYNLTISNMPQLKEVAPGVAGGDDWEYVAYVEVLEAPQAQDVELSGGQMSGDIRHLRDNLYRATEADAISAVALFFDDNAPDAEGRMQLWSDAETLESEISIEDAAVEPIEPPSDEFYILFDYRRAQGVAMGYDVTSEAGEALGNGESLSITHSLDAGDYVGLNQYNLDEVDLNASIRSTDGTVLVEETVGVSTGDSPPRSVYWYADDAQEVELRLQNTSGDDVDYLTYEVLEGTAEPVSGIDGSPVSVDYEGTLAAGTRHYYELEVTWDDLLSIARSNAVGDAHLELYDSDGERVMEATNQSIVEVESGDYVLAVKAVDDLSNFSIDFEESQIFDVEETSAPGIAIPDNDASGITDTINVASCPNITEIEVTLDITHTFIGDLIIEVTSPAGETVRIHDRSGGASDDIQDTYPFPADDANLDDGEGLLDFVDSDGSGEWEIFVSDNAFADTGDLNSWTLNLTCEG